MSMDRFGDYLLERMYPGEQVQAPAPAGQRQGDTLVAEVGSRGLPERAYTGVNPDKMEAIDPTVRQRLSDFLQAGFEGLGVDRYKARKDANTLLGGASSGLPLGMGIADIIPFLGTALQTEEAVRGGQNAAENAKQGQYGAAAVEGGAAALGMIPGVAGTVKAGKAAVNALKGMKSVKASEIPSLFSHGTTESAANSIMESGKFDVSNAERQYTYSQFGRQAAYLTPEKGWWLDAERAADSRAITYPSAVDAKIDPKAKIVRIDSEQELNQLAKKAGFVDAYDMMKSLEVESIDYIKEARKAKSMTLEEYAAEMKKDWPDMSDSSIKEFYDSMQTFEEKTFAESDNATKQLIDAGVDGIYISDKFAPTEYENWHPASDQLAMFRPELIKPVAKRSLNKEKK